MSELYVRTQWLKYKPKHTELAKGHRGRVGGYVGAVIMLSDTTRVPNSHLLTQQFIFHHFTKSVRTLWMRDLKHNPD